MRERLEKFIKTEGLTPSRFAEIMGVQPSSISHILGGRNKPSFDFIEKMLLRFPKINPDWLLLGKGTMYRSPEGESYAAPVRYPEKEEAQPSRAMESSGLFSEPEPQPTPIVSGISASSAATAAGQPRENTPGIPPATSPREPVSATPSSALRAMRQVPEDQIERIVLFLKDNTFITYRPK